MEKERYEINNEDCLINTKENQYVCNFCELTLFPDIVVDLLNQQDGKIKELEEENQKANIKNYLTDYYLVEKENQQLKIENGSLKEKISTQFQNNADNVDFMENQRREIERLKEDLQAKDILVNTYMSIVGTLDNAKQLKQSQNEKAIEVLEKLKNDLFDYFVTFNIKGERAIRLSIFHEVINDRIKELRSEK